MTLERVPLDDVFGSIVIKGNIVTPLPEGDWRLFSNPR